MFAVWVPISPFLVKVLRMCVAQTSRLPSIRCDAYLAICWRRGLRYLQIVKSNNHPFYYKHQLPWALADKRWHEDVKTTALGSLHPTGISAKGKHPMSESCRAAVCNSTFGPAPDTLFIDIVCPLPDQISLSFPCSLLIWGWISLLFFPPSCFLPFHFS